MPIAVVCAKCSAKLNAPDSAAGKRVKCPKCQNAMLVPEALPAEPEFEVVEEEPKPAKKPAVKPRVQAAVEIDDEEDEAPRKKRRPADDDVEDDDRPKKKKKRKREDDEDEEGSVSMTRNIVMGVVLVILLGVVAFVFYDRFKKKDEPGSSNSNSNSNKDDTAKGNIPIIPGGPQAAGGGGGPANPGINPKVAAADRLFTERGNLLKSTTEIFNKMVDRESVISGINRLNENTKRMDQITTEMKAIGPIRLEDTVGVKMTHSLEEVKAYTEAFHAAAKQLGIRMESGAIPRELAQSIQEALKGWDRAAIGFVQTMSSVMTWMGNSKEPGTSQSGLPAFRVITYLDTQGALLAAAGYATDITDGAVPSIRVWDASNGSPSTAREFLTKLRRAPGAIALSSDGKVLATFLEKEIVFWNASTGDMISTARTPFTGYSPSRMALTKDGKSLIVTHDTSIYTIAVSDGSIRVKKPEIPPQFGFVYIPGLNRVVEVRLSPGQKVAELTSWDPASDGPPIKVQLEGVKEQVATYALSDNGKVVAVCTQPRERSAKGRISFHNANDGKRISEVAEDHSPNLHQYAQLALTPDGKHLAGIGTGSFDILQFVSADLFNVADGKRTYRASGEPANLGTPFAQQPTFSSDGKWLYFIRNGSSIVKVDTETGKEVTQ
jgi:hypothetical protein